MPPFIEVLKELAALHATHIKRLHVFFLQDLTHSVDTLSLLRKFLELDLLFVNGSLKGLLILTILELYELLLL